MINESLIKCIIQYSYFILSDIFTIYVIDSIKIRGNFFLKLLPSLFLYA